ncbi:MAG: hypothetical protein HQL26_02435 [Candidatus Omnitrophica bacterium]|nr:hypothetical protein [Candidatus Omnitrophota bacterium]
MGNKSNLNITLDKKIIYSVDLCRGQLPRSTFINKILDEALKKEQDAFDWGTENGLAEADIKMGKVKKFTHKSEAMKWLKS